MKRTVHLVIVRLLSAAVTAVLCRTVLAAVPLSWDVRPGQPAPVMFDRYHGETLSFAATFRGFGDLPFSPDADIRLWYQTNGMGQAWWSVPATVQSNVLSATWSPTLDPGTDRVSLFFGAPSNAYAAAVLRLRHSPGFAPGDMPDPIAFHESDPIFTAWLAAFSESDPVFTSWLSTFEIPETSLEPSTNYTDRALGAFAETGTVERARGYGSPTRWTDVTGCVWESSIDVHAPWDGWVGGRLVYDEDWDVWSVATAAGTDILGYSDGEWGLGSITHSVSLSAHAPLDATRIVLLGNGDPVTLTRSVTITNLVGRVALTNDIPAAPDLSPIQQDIADLRTESALVYRLYSGSNVVAEVTNYNSQVHAPELRLMQLNESNEYITVWTETNGLARTYRDATNYTDGAILDRAAPRAWSRTTSGLGFAAPDGMTWVSTSNLVIAGGLEYEKHVTSGGAIWLLESNGMTADFHASNNNTAYLDISAADGTSIFRIEKTDSFLVGVNVNSVTVDGSTLVCGVNVVATEHPLVRVKAQLSDASWSKEEDGTTSGGVTTISGLASIAWSGTAGNWTCRITNLTGGNSLFAQMEYLQEGGTKIVNTAPLDVGQGILCTDGVHKCRAVYNNGTITWEPVP